MASDVVGVVAALPASFSVSRARVQSRGFSVVILALATMLPPLLRQLIWGGKVVAVSVLSLWGRNKEANDLADNLGPERDPCAQQHWSHSVAVGNQGAVGEFLSEYPKMDTVRGLRSRLQALTILSSSSRFLQQRH